MPLPLRLILVLVTCQAALADPTTPEMFNGGEPYCGIYSLYGASRLLGGHLSLRELVRPQYIGSWEGSSIAELQLAAKDHGLVAVAFSNLSLLTIARAGCPAILHVLSDSATGKYDHWILFLGEDHGQVRVLDPPSGIMTIGAGDLLERWDNTALLVSSGRVPYGPLIVADLWRPVCCILAMILIAHLASMLLARKRLDQMPTRFEIIVVLAVVLAGCMTWNSVRADGMFFRTDAGSTVAEASARTLCPHVGLRAVKAAVASGSAIIVDARYASDFARNHIPNAISLLPASNIADVRAKLRGVPPNKSMIVYCEDPVCSFASIVAGKLMGAGYRNVAIFSDGWEAWRSQQ
jgi:rhodanese-related sulfurtransferase